MRVYLLASFPSLSFHDKAPMPFERLVTDCARQLSLSDFEELDAVCSPPPAGDSAFAKAWAGAWEGFRAVNARQRLDRLPHDPAAHARTSPVFPPDAMRADLAAAWEETDPLKRETALLRAKWNWIEERRRAAPLSLADLLGYALQLKLLERKDRWDEAHGQTQFDEHTQAFLDPVIDELRTQDLSA